MRCENATALLNDQVSQSDLECVLMKTFCIQKMLDGNVSRLSRG